MHPSLSYPPAEDRSAMYRRRRLTPGKTIGYSLSIVFSMTLLGYSFSRSVGLVGSDANVPVRHVSGQSSGEWSTPPGGDHDGGADAIRRRARSIDRELMRLQRHKTAAETTSPVPSLAAVRDAYDGRIEAIQEIVRRDPDARPGSPAWDAKRLLDRYLADPPPER